MAYSENLAERVRTELSGKRKLIERKMFGGLCFMWRGNMLCGITDENFMARVSPKDYDSLLRESGTSAMLIKEKPMKGFIIVSNTKIRTKSSLQRWLGLCEKNCKSLPKK